MYNSIVGAMLILASSTPTIPIVPKESAILIEEPTESLNKRRECRQLDRKKRQNRLFEWLRSNHYLCSQYGQRNIPTQKTLGNGLFEVKVRSVELPDGLTKTVFTTVITGKGQIYFINKFLNK